MKKVLLMINPLLFWKPGNQVRFSTHIAGCEARLIAIIDDVQRETVLHQVFRRTVFYGAEVGGSSQPVSVDHGIEPKPMTPDWYGPLAFIGTSFSTGRPCAKWKVQAAAAMEYRRNKQKCRLSRRHFLGYSPVTLWSEVPDSSRRHSFDVATHLKLPH
jgi:hypothetical protein